MNYDFVVLGGGSAGYAAARTAAGVGLKACVIEGAREVGGLCILRGCMPSKSLIESANRFRAIGHAPEFGLRVENATFDTAEILARKRRLIEEFAEYRRQQLNEGDFDFIRGTGSFIDTTTLRVRHLDGGEETVTAKSFLISTGSEISFPDIPGLARASCLTSDDVLELATSRNLSSFSVQDPWPSSSLTTSMPFGRGSRSCNAAHRLRRDSTKTRPKSWSRVFRKRGMNIFTKTKLLQVESNGTTSRVIFEHEGTRRTVEAAAILNALGRKPKVAGLGLENVGVELADGAIAVNAHQQTSVPHDLRGGRLLRSL